MISNYHNRNGDEYYITLEPGIREADFKKSITSLIDAYFSICAANNLDTNTTIYVRIYVSDIYNQKQILKDYLASAFTQIYYTIIGQPPASGSRIGLEAYHMRPTGSSISKEVHNDKVIVTHNYNRSLWGNFPPESKETSYNQTWEILERLTAVMSTAGATLKENVIRTWFFIRDIDNNYQGMVQSRKEFFTRYGMTRDTNFIASTGIEGACMFPENLVQLHYLSCLRLKPGQQIFMTAPGYMNPTHEYGVTFERGTQLLYGDRSHYYISGTASIDDKGNILYPSDILKQAERTLINIQALLHNYQSSLDDLKLVLVYLRDFSNYSIVNAFLKNNLPPTVCYLLLTASVCRPGWLIEIEGIAANDIHNKNFNNYL